MTDTEKLLILTAGVAALVAKYAADQPREEPPIKEREESDELAHARNEGWEAGYSYLHYHGQKRILTDLSNLLNRII